MVKKTTLYNSDNEKLYPRTSAECVGYGDGTVKDALDSTGVGDYPAFSASTAYSAGDVVNYNGKLYKFTADHAAGAWTGTDAEETDIIKAHIVQELGDSEDVVVSQRVITEEIQYAQFGYYKDVFVVGTTGKIQPFNGLCIFTIPYTSGDEIEVVGAVDPDGVGDNKAYNFYSGGNFLGGAANLDNIPETTDTIIVNGNYHSHNGIVSVTINGKPYNIRSLVYKNATDIANNTANIAKNTADIKVISSFLSFEKLHTYIDNWGDDGIWKYTPPDIIITYKNGVYQFECKTPGNFVALENNDISGKNVAYFIDVEFNQIGERETFQFGSIQKIQRKTLQKENYGGSFQGKRIQAVFKLIGATSSDTHFYVAIFPSSLASEQVQKLTIYKMAIIDLGEEGDELYGKSEKELEELFNNSYIKGNTVFIQKGKVEDKNKFYNEDDELIAEVTEEAVKGKSFTDLDGNKMMKDLPLFGKEIFTVGDSLCSEGSWQPRFAELTGAKFNADYNRDNISVGGTTSLGSSIYSGQNRLKKLLSEKTPEVIILENINDFTTNVKDSDYSYMIGNTSISKTTYENYSAAYGAKQNEINLIGNSDRSIGHALRIGYTSQNGKKVIITGTATSNKTAIVRVGSTRTNINIVTGDTAVDVIAKIYEVYWPGYDKFTDNATYVAFVNTDGGAADIGLFQLDGNGLTVQQDAYESTSYVDFYYIGQSTDDDTFKNISNWVDVANMPISAVYKGMFEYIFTKLPTCRVMLFIPTRMPIQWAEDGNGWDASLWLEKGVRVNMNYYKNSYTHKTKYDTFRKFQREIAELYGVEVYDINETCGINPINYKSFYPSYNVHPLTDGYLRFAEAFAKMIR